MYRAFLPRRSLASQLWSPFKYIASSPFRAFKVFTILYCISTLFYLVFGTAVRYVFDVFDFFSLFVYQSISRYLYIYGDMAMWLLFNDSYERFVKALIFFLRLSQMYIISVNLSILNLCADIVFM